MVKRQQSTAQASIISEADIKNAQTHMKKRERHREERNAGIKTYNEAITEIGYEHDADQTLNKISHKIKALSLN